MWCISAALSQHRTPVLAVHLTISSVPLVRPCPSSAASGQKWDPRGLYIRRWVPELRDLDVEIVHEPWRSPDVSKFYRLPCVDPKRQVKFRREAPVQADGEEQGNC